MRLDAAIRLSFYLTLALACACLAQAEMFFMPWFGIVCVPAALLVFVLAWRHEGEWLIRETASNYLGILIVFAIGGWTVLQVPHSDQELASGGVPWPAGLLPHLGLLLLTLLAVKLFRPKALSDFWVIQTIGLMVVTLGCVLAGDPLFAGLLFAYLVSLIWCLALFQRYRADRPVGGPLFTPAHAPLPAPPPPWRCFARSLGWSAVVLCSGLLLFLTLPRNRDSQWLPQKLSTSAGTTMMVGVETGLNLNRVGTIELSPAPAFHVTVTNAAGRPTTLSGDQLWRVDVLDYYMRGHWMTYAQAQDVISADGATEMGRNSPAPAARRAAPVSETMPVEDPAHGQGPSGAGMHFLARQGRPITPSVPPRADVGQRYLRYRLRPLDAGGLVVAEPLDLRYIGIEPMVGSEAPVLPLFFEVPGGDSVLSMLPLTQRRECFYTQVVVGRGVGRLPAVSYTESYRDHLLLGQVPDQVVDWARGFLTTHGQLGPAQRRLDEEGRVPAEHHAAVSRALCHYLAYSGDYTYTLNLRREAHRLDPTADFLLNVKTGHCERFAGALALALRGLGIPARVVKGYRGAEEEEEPGNYVVRLDQAHSWVQVLSHEDDGWAWLTLDPTPGLGEAANPLTTWLTSLADLDYEQLWRRFVLNYNGDAQTTALSYLARGLWHNMVTRRLLWLTPVGLVLAVALVVLWRRRGQWRRRAARIAAASSPPDFYRRLLRVLARRFALEPLPGQTPREFALVAARVLAQEAATARWADLPIAAAGLLYRIRFAGEALSAAEADRLRRQLTELAAM